MQEASGAQTGHLPTYMRANIQTDRAADLGSNLGEGQREERQRQPCCVTFTRKEVSHMVDKQPHEGEGLWREGKSPECQEKCI